ncbi:hypothetical protein LIER_22139 [Lithospermum erythrorhizon]|uniref:Uncharacterized protein n=1 Tax=Lithospermum erythrorhizon TaxID=34254 RepID=A0AAV3QV28_LITER
MSSNQVDISSDHSGSPNYASLVFANIRSSSSQGISSAGKIVPATQASPANKNKKRVLVRGVNLPSSNVAAPGSQVTCSPITDKQGEDLTIIKKSLPGILTSLSHAKGWNIFMDGKPGKVVESRWHSLWCFLKGGICAWIPKVWVPLKKVDRPRSTPTDDTFAALEKLRRIFRHKMYWKIFCE